MGLRIEPLTAATWARFAAFAAGRESSDLHWCWCQFWRLRSKDFGAAKVPELRARLQAQATEGEPPGLVAIEVDDATGEERAVGWVSLGPRTDFERIERSKVIPRIDDRPVWSIVCFSVATSARGRGIGRALLEGAVEHARNLGVASLEAYPVTVGPDDSIDPAAAFTGTLSMFEGAGFSLVADRASDRSSRRPRVVVRRELAAEGRG